MAKGNMILTLVAQSRDWAKGLKKAAGDAVTFGSVVKGVMKAVSAAILGIAGAIILFLPNFIKMGEEVRKSERRLANIATNMGLFKDNTEEVTKRLSDYATTLSFATGVDDELIRGNEAVLLTFKNLASSAEKVGGPFDRATKALLDLEAAGKNVKAVQLGRALQDPVKGLTALRRAGILFNASEVTQIENLMKHNDLLGAQDMILKQIEGQVGGTAEATASASEKMAARFEDIAETMSGALLPAVDELVTQFSEWLDSDEGRAAIQDMTDKFKEFGDWITSPNGKKAIGDLIDLIGFMAGGLQNVAGWLSEVYDWWLKVTDAAAYYDRKYGGDYGGGVTTYPGAPTVNPNIPTPSTGTSTPTIPSTARIQVNVTGLTPTATIGKTVIDAVKNAQRLGAR